MSFEFGEMSTKSDLPLGRRRISDKIDEDARIGIYKKKDTAVDPLSKSEIIERKRWAHKENQVMTDTSGETQELSVDDLIEINESNEENNTVIDTLPQAETIARKRFVSVEEREKRSRAAGKQRPRVKESDVITEQYLEAVITVYIKNLERGLWSMALTQLDDMASQEIFADDFETMRNLFLVEIDRQLQKPMDQMLENYRAMLIHMKKLVTEKRPLVDTGNAQSSKSSKSKSITVGRILYDARKEEFRQEVFDPAAKEILLQGFRSALEARNFDKLFFIFDRMIINHVPELEKYASNVLWAIDNELDRIEDNPSEVYEEQVAKLKAYRKAVFLGAK